MNFNYFRGLTVCHYKVTDDAHENGFSLEGVLFSFKTRFVINRTRYSCRGPKCDMIEIHTRYVRVYLSVEININCLLNCCARKQYVIQFTLIHRVLIFSRLAHTIINNFDKLFKLLRRVYQFSCIRTHVSFSFYFFFLMNKTITNRVFNQQLPLIRSARLPLNIFNS